MNYLRTRSWTTLGQPISKRNPPRDAVMLDGMRCCAMHCDESNQMNRGISAVGVDHDSLGDFDMRHLTRGRHLKFGDGDGGDGRRLEGAAAPLGRPYVQFLVTAAH
jgi:hypothetical protein